MALFSALEQTHCTLVTCDSEWATIVFHGAFFNIHQSGVLTALFGCYMAGAKWSCCRLGARSLYTTGYPHAPVYSVTSCKATFLGCMCSAVTCHLHFWQNDREYFHSTAVTQGWNGYRNKSQHRMDPSTAPPLSRFYREVSQAAAGKRACEPI